MQVQRSQLGGGLLCLGGAIIAYVPLVVIPNTGMILGAIGDDLRLVGASFGLLVVCCGALALLKPAVSLQAGIAGIVLALCSFVGAFGGLVLGALLAVAGGGLCLSAGLDDVDVAEAVARSTRIAPFAAGEESAGTAPRTEKETEFTADEGSFQFESASETAPAAAEGDDAAGQTEAETETDPTGDTLFGTDGEN